MRRNKEHRGAVFGGAPMVRPPHWVCVLCFCSFIYSSYQDLCIFVIYYLHIPYMFLKYVPYISLVCFLIYGGKSRSGHDRSRSFGPISHASAPKLTFWCNFIMVLHGFAWRSSKTLFFNKNNAIFIQNMDLDRKIPDNFRWPGPLFFRGRGVSNM